MKIDNSFNSSEENNSEQILFTMLAFLVTGQHMISIYTPEILNLRVLTSFVLELVPMTELTSLENAFESDIACGVGKTIKVLFILQV